MTTIRTCDKCGCVIPNGKTFTHIRAEGRGSFDEFMIINDSYDLCPGCATRFMEWLHTKVVEE